MGFLKQACLRWSPAFRQQAGSGRSRFRIQVSKDFPDHRRVFNTGDDVQGRTNAAGAWMRKSGHFDRTATLATDFNVNVEYAFESLRPLVRMSWCREAQGCARAARSLMPGARRGFDPVSRPVALSFCLYPAWPESPMLDICYSVRTPRGSG